MATPSNDLIHALRNAATAIENGSYYAWGHHGACNCGHVLQAATKLSKEEIRKYATTGIGEWTEIVQGECDLTGLPVEMLLVKLREMGLNSNDIHHLEYLSDRDVLQFLPSGFRWLERNKREDVILYFRAMSNMLEEQMLRNELVHTSIPSLLIQA
jgi:hypothetical protein